MFETNCPAPKPVKSIAVTVRIQSDGSTFTLHATDPNSGAVIEQTIQANRPNAGITEAFQGVIDAAYEALRKVQGEVMI